MRERVYLAARYSRNAELFGYGGQLSDLGYDVQAEWTTGVHHDTDSARCADIDFNEVSDADIVISFTEPEGQIVGRGRGGRHVEFGIALALGLRVIVVGHRENVFHHHPSVEFFATWAECMEALR